MAYEARSNDDGVPPVGDVEAGADAVVMSGGVPPTPLWRRVDAMLANTFSLTSNSFPYDTTFYQAPSFV